MPRITHVTGFDPDVASPSFTIDVGVAADRFVEILAVSNANSLTNAVINGVTVTPQDTIVNDAAKNCHLIYALVPGTGVITVTLNYNGTGRKDWIAASYSGIGSVRGTPVKGKASGTALSLTAPTASGDLISLLGWDSNNGATITPTAPATAFSAGSKYGLESTASSTSTVIAGTLDVGGTPWAAFALALVPSGVAATTLAGDGSASSSGTAELPSSVTLSGDGVDSSVGSGQLLAAVDLAGDGSASISGSAQLPTAVELAADGTAPTMASAQLPNAAELAGNGTSAASASGMLAIPTITTAPFKNNTGALLANTAIPKVGIYRLSDLTLVLFFSTLSTNASGQLVIQNDALVTGADYLLMTSDATGAAVGVSKNTAV